MKTAGEQQALGTGSTTQGRQRVRLVRASADPRELSDQHRSEAVSALLAAQNRIGARMFSARLFGARMSGAVRPALPHQRPAMTLPAQR